MRTTRSLYFACALLASSGTLLVSSPAVGAPSSKPILVLESHIGVRPAGLDLFLKHVDNMLETRGYAALPSSVLRLAGNRVPRPGILDPNITAADLAERHNDAFAKFRAARWQEARDALIRVRELVRRNPALVANDVSNHDLMFRSMVALAVCYQRLGDNEAAMDAMKDAIRTYPTRPVSRADAWGPEGETLYLSATAQLKGIGRGRLTIAAGDPNAQIALEGQQRGVGHVSIADLLPGTYRVFIRTSTQDPGRQYMVTVKPGDETRLTTDVSVDRLLQVTDNYVALIYPHAGERKNDCALASDLAQRWTNTGAALVLASGEENGRPAVVGVRCRDGVEIRRAIIYTDTPEANTADKLVPFLDDITKDEVPANAPTTAKPPWYPKAILGVGGLVLAGSTVAYLVAPADDHTQPTYDDKRTPAVEVYTGGAVVVGIGVYLWLTKDRHMGRWEAAMFGGAATSCLLAALYIPTDEDPARVGKQRPTYRDTATGGIALAGVGAAFAVTGYLVWRHDRTSTAPTLSASRGGVTLGWAGSF